MINTKISMNRVRKFHIAKGLDYIKTNLGQCKKQDTVPVSWAKS